MGVPINNVTRRVVYAASGTGPYNFTFEILANTDIAVYRDDTLLTLTADYTVTINANGTGYVTLTATPTGATQIAIVGNRTISRTTDFVTGGDFFANTLNDELDQQTIFAQQNAEGLGRALTAPQTDPTSINMVLPGRTDRANKYLAFDANGNPFASTDLPQTIWYGNLASDPATRPDGTSRQVGDLYYNTTVSMVRLYTTNGWVNFGAGTYTIYRALATAGQTVITTNYVIGSVQVYINGSLLHTAEFTATNGTSITVSALSLNDEITVISTNQLAFAVPVIVSTASPSGTATNGALWLRVAP
ncbi:hypothetical protein EBT31_08320 [bacterium]|nr:hypothetical protein [bacterium]